MELESERRRNMIFDSISNKENYKEEKEIYQTLNFLEKLKKWDDVESNAIIQKDWISANPVSFLSKDESECMYEAHRKHIDVHYIMEGIEKIATADVKNLQEKVPFDKDKDIGFYEGCESGSYLLKTGDFMVCFPSDAHKVGMMNTVPGMVKKVVVKIRVEATLSRFAKKIGYRGYQEFIYQYENTFEEKEEKITGNTKIVLNAYQEVLNKTYNLVDEAQIGRIVGYLNKADRVLVCGCGSSGLSAKEMEIRFMRIGIDVDSMTDSDMIKMASVFQNRRSLIFGFSISGEREEVTYLLREAYNKGAKTVLFTTNNGKKFSEYYSEVVALSSLRHLNYGNVISPQFPILIILDIIYAYYVEQNKYIREGMHDSTLCALEE